MDTAATGKSGERFDLLVAGLLVLAYFAVAAAFALSKNSFLPLGCENDQHYFAANRLLCGYARLSRTTVGPMFPWLAALLGLLTGSAYLGGKLVNLASGALLVGLTFWAGRCLTGSRAVALAAALLVALNTHLFLFSTLSCTDLPAALFWLAALFFVLRSLSENARRFDLIAAAGFALAAALTRDQVYFAVVGMAFTLLLLSPGGLWGKLRSAVLFAGAYLVFLGLYALAAVLFLQAGWGHAVGASFWATRIGAALGAGGATDLSGGASSIAANYLHSLRLTGRVLGYFPLLGLLALAMPSVRSSGPRRILPAALLVFAVYFIGVGWFPAPFSYDIRRMFLPAIPIFAVIFGYVVWRLTGSLLRLSPFAAGAVAVAVAALAGTAQAIIEVPHMEYLHSDVSRAHPDAEAINEFTRLEDPGCQPVIITSMAAATMLRQPVHLTMENEEWIDNDSIQRFLTRDDNWGRRFFYLMVSQEDAGRNRLQADVSFGPNDRYTLVEIFRHREAVFYRLVDRSPEETHN